MSKTALLSFDHSSAAHSSSEHLIEKALGDILASPLLMLNGNLWHSGLQLKAFTSRLLSFVSSGTKWPAVFSGSEWHAGQKRHWSFIMKQYDREILSVLMTYRGNRDRDCVSSNDLGKNTEMGFLFQHESLVENERGGREGERHRGKQWNITWGREMARREDATSGNYIGCKNREIGRIKWRLLPDSLHVILFNIILRIC